VEKEEFLVVQEQTPHQIRVAVVEEMGEMQEAEVVVQTE
jgi:hypothetical protein